MLEAILPVRFERWRFCCKQKALSSPLFKWWRRHFHSGRFGDSSSYLTWDCFPLTPETRWIPVLWWWFGLEHFFPAHLISSPLVVFYFEFPEEDLDIL